MSDTVSVQATIQAGPEELWDRVADLRSMHQWSPENTGGEWVGDASGPAVGAKFKGANAHGTHRWSTTSTIVVADRPSEVAWDVTFGPLGFKVARWSFRFEPAGDGCTVTETWTDHRSKPFAWLGGKATGVADRASHNRAGMERTLEALAAASETSAD